jgi:hypothetical protein
MIGYLRRWLWRLGTNVDRSTDDLVRLVADVERQSKR